MALRALFVAEVIGVSKMAKTGSPAENCPGAVEIGFVEDVALQWVCMVKPEAKIAQENATGHCLRWETGECRQGAPVGLPSAVLEGRKGVRNYPEHLPVVCL